MIEIRKTELSDIEDVMRVYSYARKFMAENGNPFQWGDNYPSEDLICGDIAKGNGYVAVKDGKVCGSFAFIIGEDPTYQYIEGEWLNSLPYGTIHRIASDGSFKGMLPAAIEYAGKIIKNIKIDTYKDNTVMQHLLDKNGFTKCGTIYLEDGAPRIAYQKVLK